MMKRAPWVLFLLQYAQQAAAREYTDMFSTTNVHYDIPAAAHVHNYDSDYDSGRQSGKKEAYHGSKKHKHPKDTYADLFSTQNLLATVSPAHDGGKYYHPKHLGGRKYHFFVRGKGLHPPHLGTEEFYLFGKGKGYGKGLPSKGKGVSKPTQSPASEFPSRSPSTNPSASPTKTSSPSSRPTVSLSPTYAPSSRPSKRPSVNPSSTPTGTPSSTPTAAPSVTFTPSLAPSTTPTIAPSRVPSRIPSSSPTAKFPPTAPPTTSPVPTGSPTLHNSISSKLPTSLPSMRPTFLPTQSSNAPFTAIAPSFVPSALTRPPSPLPTQTPSSPNSTSLVVAANPFGAVYILADGSNPTPEHFTTAADLTLAHIDIFLSKHFASIPETSYVGQVSFRTTTTTNPIAIDFDLTAIFGQDSSDIPTAAAVSQLIQQSLSAPAVDALIDEFNALSASNPFSSTSNVSFVLDAVQLVDAESETPSTRGESTPPFGMLSFDTLSPPQNASGDPYNNSGTDFSAFLQMLIGVCIAGILIGTIGLLVLKIRDSRFSQNSIPGLSEASGVLLFVAEENVNQLLNAASYNYELGPRSDGSNYSEECSQSCRIPPYSDLSVSSIDGEIKAEG